MNRNTITEYVDNIDAVDFNPGDLLLDPGSLRFSQDPGIPPQFRFGGGLAQRLDAQAKATTIQPGPTKEPALNPIPVEPTFPAVMTELQEVARKLDQFHLRVSLHWKKYPEKPLPPPELIKIPEMPRYVSEDLAKEVCRVELRRNLAMERLKRKKPHNNR